jgi:hypothetical protein
MTPLSARFILLDSTGTSKLIYVLGLFYIFYDFRPLSATKKMLTIFTAILKLHFLQCHLVIINAFWVGVTLNNIEGFHKS